MASTEEPRFLAPGVGAAFAAAVLFGLSTPFAKMLLGEVSPVLLAGLLYIGSGLGLTIVRLLRVRLVRRRQSISRTGGAAPEPLASSESLAHEASVPRAQWPWLAGAVLFGGALGPVLLMLGLNSTA